MQTSELSGGPPVGGGSFGTYQLEYTLACYACLDEKKRSGSRRVYFKSVSSSGCDDCYLVPGPGGGIHSEKPVLCNEATSAPRRGSAYASAFLDGNYARRKHPTKHVEYTIWDTELKGFGHRVLPSGSCFWTVRSRQRGKHLRVTLGRPDEIAALVARTQALRLLQKQPWTVCLSRRPP
jgi:hypothetical protein